MSDRIEMTVKMQVTPAQGLALQAMFNHWNKMASWGCSRYIGFYVDGDGNFHPKAEVEFNAPMHQLTDEMAGTAVIENDGDGNLMFDCDPIAWMLHDLPEPPTEQGE